MAIQFSPEEILETIRMVQMENLDIRTITSLSSLVVCSRNAILDSIISVVPAWRSMDKK